MTETKKTKRKLKEKNYKQNQAKIYNKPKKKKIITNKMKWDEKGKKMKEKKRNEKQKKMKAKERDGV